MYGLWLSIEKEEKTDKCLILLFEDVRRFEEILDIMNYDTMPVSNYFVAFILVCINSVTKKSPVFIVLFFISSSFLISYNQYRTNSIMVRLFRKLSKIKYSKLGYCDTEENKIKAHPAPGRNRILQNIM